MKVEVVSRLLGLTGRSITVVLSCGHKRRYQTRTNTQEKKVPAVGQRTLCRVCAESIRLRAARVKRELEEEGRWCKVCDAPRFDCDCNARGVLGGDG